MKSKTFSLLSLSVLASILLISLVSAVSLAEWKLTENGNAINVNSNINPGTFTSSGVTFNEFDIDDGANAEDWSLTGSIDSAKYFEVKISPNSNYNLIISDIDFDYSASIIGPASLELQYSKQSGFASPTSIIIEEDVSTTEKSSTNSVNIEVNSGETLTLRLFGYDFNADTNELRIKNLIIEGTANPVESEELNFCEYDDGVSANEGNLKVKISDVQVISEKEAKSFGEDEEWLLFDEIEVEIEVKNDGDFDIDDVVVEWGIYDSSAEEWVVEVNDIDKFNIKNDKEEILTFNFRVDDNDFDVDIDEIDGKYLLYVRATGDISDRDSPDDGDETCASDSKEIEVIVESDFVVLKDFEFQEVVSCDSEIQIVADVWNIGDNDQDEVRVYVSNTELGINNQKIDIGDIDSFSDEKLVFSIQIPKDAEEGWYNLKFTVADEDDNTYENDYNDDESTFIVSFKIEGSCALESQALVAASLKSGGKAGKELVVGATITNTGSKITTYSLNIAGADWASSVDLDQSIVVLNAGESKEVLITLDVKRDVSGEKTFNIEVLSDNELVKSQPVAVTIEKAGFGSITGGIISESNWYLWGIGALNFILVIVIIFVAFRIIRK